MTARTFTTYARAAAAAGIVLLARALPSAGGSGPCQLLVVSRPPRATVFVDGEELGPAPVTVTGLKTGVHILRVVLKDHRPWSKRVRLSPGPRSIVAELVKEGEGAKPSRRSDHPRPFRRPSKDGPKKDSPEEENEEAIPRTIEVSCPLCKGSGLIQETGCPACGTDGYVGANPCDRCGSSGRAEYICRACKGEGRLTVRGKEVNCRLCGGRGAPPCPLCKGTGKIKRPNPDAVSYPTVTCASCAGTGYEQQLKCPRCGGRGTVTVAGAGGGRLGYSVVSCPQCGGDGTGPPTCKACRGRGYVGPARAVTPCMRCGGTGHRFIPCRTCRGKGWRRDR